VVAADLVANAADGANQGAVGAGVNLAAQIIDVDIHDVGDGVAVDAPDFLDDGRTGDGSARISKKEFEQRIFLGAQFDGLAGAIAPLAKSSSLRTSK